jgi:hypothetical protein
LVSMDSGSRRIARQLVQHTYLTWVTPNDMREIAIVLPSTAVFVMKGPTPRHRLVTGNRAYGRSAHWSAARL